MPFQHRHAIRVEFGNCDPARIVFYPTYFAWFDVATHHLFEAAGLPWRDLPDRWGIQAPVVDVTARFVSPAIWGDDLVIDSHVSRFGLKSFVVAHRVALAESETVVVEGTETRVCVRLDPSPPRAISSVAVPDEMRQRLG